MGKTLTFKSGYDPQSIISRSDIGNLTDNGDGTIDATGIDSMDIRNLLGEDTNNLGQLCLSSKVNMWALFKPGRVSYDSNGNVFHDKPDGGASDPYEYGDFLGYNHDAQKPEVNGSNQAYHEDDSTITIFIAFSQEEFNWDEMPNVGYFYVVIKDGSTTIKEKQYEIDYSKRNQTIDTDIDVNSWSSDKTLTIELWAGTSTEKKALIDTGQTELTYKELTNFNDVLLDPDATMAGYSVEHRYETIDAANDTFSLEVKILNSSGSQVSETCEIQVSVSGGTFQTVDSSKYISGAGYTPLSYTFPQGIDEYGDSWTVRLVTNLT